MNFPNAKVKLLAFKISICLRIAVSAAFVNLIPIVIKITFEYYGYF